jgi:transposase
MTKRKFLTPEQKIAIVREHLLEGVPESALVDKHKIHAVQFYQWQKLLVEQGAVVFERKPNAHNVRRQESAKDEKIEQLEAKIKNKNDVMAELLEGKRTPPAGGVRLPLNHHEFNRHLLRCISQCRDGSRPGRFQPRCVKRRMDQYQLIMEPRNQLRHRLSKEENSSE